MEGDSEAEDAVVDDSLQVPSYVSAPVGGGRPLANEVGPPQRKDLAQVKNEVDRLQQQQLAISDMLNKLRRDHIALSQQAVQFQNQHNRHEQSINAILTFLANVFRKSLEEQGGTQTVQDLLANVIPGPQMHGQSHQMSQGSVFDLGDLFKQDSGSPAINQITRTQRLLPAAPQGVGEAGTISPPPMPSPLPQSTGITPPPMGTVTELLDNPQTSEHELQSHRLESIKRIIQDTNASKGSLSLSELAANSSRVDTTGISRTEASNMAAAMAAPLSGTTATVSDPSPAAGLPSPLLPGSAAGLSLSPIFSSISPPNLHDIQATDEEIEALQQSLQGQSHKIEEITSLLNPLSPSGRTSGLGAESITGDYFDINQFLDANAFSGLEYNIGTGSVGLAADAGGNDFNFSLDGAGDLKPAGTVPVAGVDSGGGTYPTGRIMEPTSPNSSGDSPSTTGTLGTEEVVRSDVDGPALVHKRRRVG